MWLGNPLKNLAIYVLTAPSVATLQCHAFPQGLRNCCIFFFRFSNWLAFAFTFLCARSTPPTSATWRSIWSRPGWAGPRGTRGRSPSGSGSTQPHSASSAHTLPQVVTAPTHCQFLKQQALGFVRRWRKCWSSKYCCNKRTKLKVYKIFIVIATNWLWQ